ncbi:retrovirus-related pol polyprotein from transposon TNT 1-94 [Tanacetum coccineum]
MGTVCFGNDNFAAITRYGDYVQGNLTICHVYYVEGLRHILFSIGQFCNGDLKVAFRLNTCFIRNLEGEDLLTGSRESNLYTISISKMAASSLAQVLKIQFDNGTEFKNAILKSYYEKLGILHHTSIARTHQQIGVIECRNRILPRYNKTPYELIKGRKPNVQYFHVFGSLCYPINDRDDFGKMKPKADIGPDINYSNFQDSLKEMNDIPSQQDLDNLFGPLYKEYYAPRTPKVSDNFVANTLDTED